MSSLPVTMRSLKVPQRASVTITTNNIEKNDVRLSPVKLFFLTDIL